MKMVIGLDVLFKGSGWVNLFQMILSLTSLSYTKTKELMPSKLFNRLCLYGPILQMVIGIGVLFKGSGWVNFFQMILSLTSQSYTKIIELMPSKLFNMCCLYCPILQKVIGIGVLSKGSG